VCKLFTKHCRYSFFLHAPVLVISIDTENKTYSYKKFDNLFRLNKKKIFIFAIVIFNLCSSSSFSFSKVSEESNNVGYSQPV